MPFYEAAGVPLDISAVATREAALAVRRTAVALVLCPACGLVSNAAAVVPSELHGLAAHTILHGERLAPGPDDAPVRAERPDVLFTLREGTFWDLAGPHRWHWSPGSLARLLRTVGFDVTDLRRIHDDREFSLEARFWGQLTAMRFDLEDDLAALTDAAEGFAAAAHRQASRWQRIIEEFLGDGKRVVVWGAGAESVGFLSALGLTDAKITRAVDSEAPLNESFLPGTGQRVVPPEALREQPPDLVVVTGARQRDDARRALAVLGLRPHVLSL